MIPRAQRVAAEVAQGRHILERRPPVWEWATPAGPRLGERRARLLSARGGFRAGQRLLELGCGSGYFTGRVARLTGARVVGVDVSPDLIAEARRRDPESTFEVGDAHALDFAADSFDGVFGSSVLHHLELGPALDEIRRVLRPGGRMAFAEPNLLNPLVFAQKKIPALKHRMHETPHETAFLRWGLAQAIAGAGFRGVRSMPYGFLHPHTPAALVAAVAGLGAALERVPLVRELAGSFVIVAEKPA